MLDNFYIIKKFKNRHYNPDPLSSESNTPEDNPKLNIAFKKITSNYLYSNINITDMGDSSHFLEKPILELAHAITSSKTKSSLGIDGILY